MKARRNAFPATQPHKEEPLRTLLESVTGERPEYTLIDHEIGLSFSPAAQDSIESAKILSFNHDTLGAHSAETENVLTIRSPHPLAAANTLRHYKDNDAPQSHDDLPRRITQSIHAEELPSFDDARRDRLERIVQADDEGFRESLVEAYRGVRDKTRAIKQEGRQITHQLKAAHSINTDDAWRARLNNDYTELSPEKNAFNPAYTTSATNTLPFYDRSRLLQQGVRQVTAGAIHSVIDTAKQEFLEDAAYLAQQGYPHVKQDAISLSAGLQVVQQSLESYRRAARFNQAILGVEQSPYFADQASQIIDRLEREARRKVAEP